MVEHDVRAAHDEIMAILSSVRGKREIDRLLRDRSWLELRNELTALNADIHRRTEIHLARRYLVSEAADDPFRGSWINKGFFALLSRQVERWRRKGLFQGRTDTPIVVVGGGALPQTQVALYRALGADVISIDWDAVSVDLCRAVLKKVGCGHLQVVEANATEYSYAGVYLVVVATLVAGKHLVARRVAQTSTNSFFAPRTPVGLHCMWRESLDEASVEAAGWRRVDYYAPRGSSVGTMLFEPKTRLANG
jgi:hypothetical protein